MVQRVLFVCTGNICRSPTAEVVLREMARAAGRADIEAASAGLDGWHVGEPPDARSQAHALRRGYDLSALRARRFSPRDFERHEWVIALDDGHHAQLARLCSPEQRHQLRRAAEFDPRVPSGGVPDPYYGSARDFEQVLDLIEGVCAGILAASRP